MDTFEIKTITPVHIGNGRFLQSKTEYVFSKEYLGIVDDSKILELIGEDRLQMWVQSIEQGSALSLFLKPFVPNLKLDMISSRKIKIKF